MKRKNTRFDAKSTGQNIAALMIKNEMTRTELAEKLEITPNAVTNLIHGTNMPALETAFNLEASSVCVRNI